MQLDRRVTSPLSNDRISGLLGTQHAGILDATGTGYVDKACCLTP
jgi:hypothetical protein